MEFKFKQLEHELSALSRVFGELGARLSEVAKDVTSPGVTPPDKLIEQISTARTNFDNVRGAVHGHAATMLVSPLPKIGEVVSITALDTLLKASAAAEENKLSIEGERDRALAILSRVLAITHKEIADFKPLQECRAKVEELRNGISNIAWPHRHPESDSVNTSKHPYTTLLSFVENLDTLEDDRWIVLETTITETFGKPLFVAASRGKLVAPKVVAAEKPAAQTTAPIAAAPVADKPVEKKVVAEKAPEKPAAQPPAQVDKKVAPPAPAPAPAPVAATPQKPAAPTLTTEKKDTVEKPHPVAAPQQPATPAPAPTPAVAPAATVNATPAPAPAAAVQTPAATPVAPAAPAPVIAATSTNPAPSTPAPTIPTAAAPAPPTPAPIRATPAPAAVTTPAPASVAPVPTSTPAPVATPAVASTAPAPVAAAPAAAPVASAHAPSALAAPPVTTAPTSQTNLPSLTALATATDPAPERKTSTPVETIDKQRKEPRLAAPAPQPVAKSEPKSQEAEMVADNQAGDGSQRPQRWGFWRGNR